MTILDRFRGLLRVEYVPERRMLTPAQVWSSGGRWMPLTGSGIDVTAEAAMQAAVGACIRLIADDISSLPVDVIRKVDGDSVPSNKPAWLEYPTGRRWDTFQAHVSDVVVSLLSDGNTFVECAPDTFRPSVFKVHDPVKVTVKMESAGVVYKTPDKTFSDTDMAHIPWVRLPGQLRGLSVLEASKESAGLELAARRWAGAFFRNGGTVGPVIKHPGKPSKEELDMMRDSFNERHQGFDNAWKLAIVTGGGDITSGMVKPDEASLEPLWKHVLEEAARLYHIPPHLLGSQDPGGSSFASVEHRSIEYVQHAIVPVTTRIEAAYSRFLGRDRFIKFNVNALLRGDIAARAAWYTFAVQNKVMRPAEVRAKEDLPPDPENQGYLETPNNNAGGDPALTTEPQEAGITLAPELRIDSVAVSDEATAAIGERVGALTERVATDVAAASGQTTADIAQLHADLIDKTERDKAELRAEVEALRSSLESERDMPSDRQVLRDENGRIAGIVERRGERTIRRMVERDERGGVVRILEAVA